MGSNPGDQTHLPAAAAPYFEPLAALPGCAYCAESPAPQNLPDVADAVYCISVQEEDERTQRAAEHFHAIGLCRHVTFYRPRRGRHVEAAVWASHRDVARHALASGQQRVLVLEDDVQFTQSFGRIARRAARAIEKLPRGWWGFYLGHWP